MVGFWWKASSWRLDRLLSLFLSLSLSSFMLRRLVGIQKARRSRSGEARPGVEGREGGGEWWYKASMQLGAIMPCRASSLSLFRPCSCMNCLPIAGFLW